MAREAVYPTTRLYIPSTDVERFRVSCGCGLREELAGMRSAWMSAIAHVEERHAGNARLEVAGDMDPEGRIVGQAERNQIAYRNARPFTVAWNAGEKWRSTIYEHSRYTTMTAAVAKVNELRAAGFVAELEYAGGYEGERVYESTPLGSQTAAGLAEAAR